MTTCQAVISRDDNGILSCDGPVSISVVITVPQLPFRVVTELCADHWRVLHGAVAVPNAGLPLSRWKSPC